MVAEYIDMIDGFFSTDLLVSVLYYLFNITASMLSTR